MKAFCSFVNGDLGGHCTSKWWGQVFNYMWASNFFLPMVVKSVKHNITSIWLPSLALAPLSLPSLPAHRVHAQSLLFTISKPSITSLGMVEQTGSEWGARGKQGGERGTRGNEGTLYLAQGSEFRVRGNKREWFVQLGSKLEQDWSKNHSGGVRGSDLCLKQPYCGNTM